jgi:heterokaryon incompatibility protein Het-C
MKNYIANGRCDIIRWYYILICKYTEYGPWDTSKALVRRTLERCIHIGRQYRAQGRKQDQYEAFHLLGQAVCSIISTSWRFGG